MSPSLKIVGIAGSIRAKSYSHIVLKSIEKLLPEGSIFSSVNIGDLPHYNEDIEQIELPASVSSARSRIEENDAVIIVTPEFNHGLPGVLKNTLDWLSRPAFKSCMQDKPVLFATHSPSALGGVRAQHQLLATLSSMLCRLAPMPEIVITNIGSKVFEGQISDVATLDFLAAQIKRFLSTVKHN